MVANTPFRTTLIAPCGMDCAICMAHLRTKNPCGDCYTPERQRRRNCPIFTCGKVKGRYHHTCDTFPAVGLSSWTNDTGRDWHEYALRTPQRSVWMASVAFVKNERERWTCQECGGTIDVHHWCCFSLWKKTGVNQPARFPGMRFRMWLMWNTKGARSGGALCCSHISPCTYSGCRGR